MAIVAAMKQRDTADIGNRQQNFLNEHRIEATDQIDARRDHRRGMHQSTHRRRTFHRVRKPRLQWKLCALSDAARKHPQSRYDQQRIGNRFTASRFFRCSNSTNLNVTGFCIAEHIAGFVARQHLKQSGLNNFAVVIYCLAEAERPEESPKHHQTNQKTKVADTVHDERFVGSVAGRFAFGVEANEEETADTDQFPEYKDLKDVARENQSKHRKTKQRQERKEPVVTTGTMHMMAIRQMCIVIDVLFRQLFRHISHCKQVNACCDECHHRKHHQRQAVDVVVE